MKTHILISRANNCSSFFAAALIALFTLVTSSAKAAPGTYQVELPPGSVLANNATITFGTVTNGMSNSITLTVDNLSASSATANIALTGGNAGDFSLNKSTLNVGSGSSKTVIVTFAPSATGARTTTLAFTGNSIYNFTLSGTGTPDTTPPVITINNPNPATVECHSAYNGPGATASDAVAGTVAVTTTGNVDTNTPGNYTITYSATDGTNPTSATRLVQVVDTTPPTVNLTGPNQKTVECHHNYTDQGATASDICAGTLTPAITGSVDANTVGDYTLTFTATDGFNSTSKIRTVHVTDTTPPVLSIQGQNPKTVECGNNYNEPGVSASDACAGTLTVTTTGTVDPTTVGSYTLTYSATDPANNTVTGTRVVLVSDTTPPVVHINGNNTQTVECHHNFNDQGATASDTCSGTLTVATAGSVSANTVGDYTLTYSASDLAGNSTTNFRVVHVTDTTPPVLSIQGQNPKTIECGNNYNEPGVSASDTCAGTLTVTTTGTVDPTTVGSYTLTYSATDPANNTVTGTRVVLVSDTTPPVVSVTGHNTQTVECHNNFNDQGATASDTCSGTLTVATTGSVDQNTVGDYTLTYSATDVAGNSTSKTRTVSVVDTTPPTVTVNGQTSRTVECHHNFNDQGATATDDCSGTLTAVTTGSVDANTVGDYTLTYTATDVAGNSASNFRFVHVTDTTPPALSIQGQNPKTVECHGNFNDPGVTASDACAGTLAVTTTGTVDPNTVGSYTLTYTATDPGNNTVSDIRVVQVVDTTPPTVTVTGPNEKTVECHHNFNDQGATASDTCAGTLDVTMTGTVDTSTVGDYTLTYTATDGPNSASKLRLVHVTDTTPPVVTVSGVAEQTVECHASFSDDGATASDTCAGTLTVATTGTVDPNTVGDYILTYTAADVSGNSATNTRLVHVTDTTPPTVHVSGNNSQTVECHHNYNDPGATASDTCAGTLAVATTGSVDANTVGVYTLTYTATDPANNTTSKTRTVSVVDTTPPVITVQGQNPKTVECHHNFNDPGATASDTCAGDLVVTTTGTVDANTPGDYTLTYTADDSAGVNNTAVLSANAIVGNTASAIRVVHVVDTTPPTVHVNGNNTQTVECHHNFNDPGATASDDCAGTLSVTTTGSVDPNTVGIYTLTYTATDGPNIASNFRTVNVIDTTPPTVVLNGNAERTVECHHNYNDPSATASDDCAGTLSVTTSGSVDANTVGDYTLTYAASDISGNSATNFRVVHVTDTTPPALSIQGQNPKTVECHNNFNDPGATASDTCAGTLNVTTTGTVDPNIVGFYTLTYTATDPANNTVSDTRLVQVVDTTPPTVHLNGNNTQTVECHHNFNDQGATASDDCAGTLTTVTTGLVDADTVGVYTLTYTATDIIGNSASRTRIVSVVDTTPPSLSIQGQNPKTVECHGNFNDPGATASDTCAGTLNVTTTGTVDPNTVGIYTLTYSATDLANNTSSDTRVVQVVDTTPPTIHVNGNNSQTVECHHNFNDQGATASDDCAGTLDVTTTGTVDANTVGDYTLTYTATDPANNTTSKTRTVSVVDTTPPVITVQGQNPKTVECHHGFNDPGATASDICAGNLVVTTTGSVDANTPGDYTLTYTADDSIVVNNTAILSANNVSSGNTASATRVVHVVDTTPPVLSIQGQNPKTVECHNNFNDPGATASDTCAGTLTVTTTGTVDTTTVGSYTLTYSTTDPANNTSSDTRVVQVVDTTPPTIHVNGNNSQTVECHHNFNDQGATASDDCVGTLDVTTTGTVDANTVGDYTLTYTATDPANNTTSKTRTVSVVDTTPPIVVLNGQNPKIVECHNNFNDPGATASDTCAGTLIVTITGTVDANTPGDYTLTYTANDGASLNSSAIPNTPIITGNTTSAIRVVHVVDTTPPTVHVNGNNSQTVECHHNYNDPGVTASDTCAGTLDVTTSGSVNANLPGDYTLTYTATDVVGNSNSKTRTVSVVDTTPPVITVQGQNPKTVECHHNFNDPGATASDTCAGTLNVTITGTVDANTPGDYTLTYTANDGAIVNNGGVLIPNGQINVGNTASAIRVVHVVDTTPPTVHVNGNNTQTVECHHNFNDPGATASDDCAGTLDVTTTGSVNANVPGSYTLTYTATDSFNPASNFRLVQVVDTTPPVVVLNGNDSRTIECHHNFNDPGATASDTCAGTLDVTITGTVDANTPGDYTLTYTANDGALIQPQIVTPNRDFSGNSASVIRVVHVVDTTPPVVHVKGQNPDQVLLNTHYHDPGATASDACAGTLEVTTTGAVDHRTLGYYTLTYTATDPTGNSASDTRVVQVYNEFISLTCSSDILATATSPDGAVVNFTNIFADSCDGATLTSVPASGSLFPVGETLVTSSLTDSCGHTQSCSFYVTVILPVPAAVEFQDAKNLMPPADAAFYGLPNRPVTFGGNVIIRDLRLRDISPNLAIPDLGSPRTDTYTTVADFGLSLDGGTTFNVVGSTATVTVLSTRDENVSGKSFVDTEMLALSLNIGNGTLLLRESPTKASLGRETVRGTLGSYWISGFFDVWTEVSLDNGTTWIPTHTPIHTELRSIPRNPARTPPARN